ncbi:MAG: hypothetical protein L3J11_09255 [Draconibacterium sp.]|nr:hypothetical protein [Draconibacterium sp.]
MKQISILFYFILCLIQLSAQNHYARFESIDVKNYIFEIHLNDSTNSGMKVSRIIFNGNPVTFSHQNDQLKIDFNSTMPSGSTIDFVINYSGIPSDGLIISTNKFGDRTFFGDNWPNRARNWQRLTILLIKQLLSLLFMRQRFIK